MESYKTLMKPVTAEIIEKKSTFTANACSVETVDDAIAFVRKIAKQHLDASHNVYAYIIGDSYKYYDDGEPSMTAGAPVYGVIKGFGLINTVIVVTRYFGGVLLGTGGLIRAYSSAAKTALDFASSESLIVERVLHEIYKLTVPYQLINKMEHLLSVNSVPVLEKSYDASVRLTTAVRKEKLDFFIEMVNNMKYAGDCGQLICEKIVDTYL